MIELLIWFLLSTLATLNGYFLITQTDIVRTVLEGLGYTINDDLEFENWLELELPFIAKVLGCMWCTFSWLALFSSGVISLFFSDVTVYHSVIAMFTIPVLCYSIISKLLDIE